MAHAHRGQAGAAPTAADELLHAVETFCRRPKAGRSGSELGDELILLRRTCDLLELEFSETAGEFAASDQYEREGSVTVIDWIRHECKMGGHTAADRVCVGEQLARLPLSSEALAEGQIGFAHLSLLAHTARALSAAPNGRGFEEGKLLKKAVESSPGRLRHVCQHARHAGDPEGFAAEELALSEARQLQLRSCPDGVLMVQGRLDPRGGTVLRTALEPLARPAGSDDGRGREQRLADALVELASHSLDSGQVPQQASQRANLQVTTSLETLLGLAGAPAAELEFSPPISARAVQRLACDSTVTRVLPGSDSAVIDVGRARREVSGTTRRALNLRDDGCRWPAGSGRPASWSEAHHLIHWVDDGPTDLSTLSNLILLCYHHHWRVHEGGWQLVRTEEGRLLTVPPPPQCSPPAVLDQRARGPDVVAAA